MGSWDEDGTPRLDCRVAMPRWACRRPVHVLPERGFAMVATLFGTPGSQTATLSTRLCKMADRS